MNPEFIELFDEMEGRTYYFEVLSRIELKEEGKSFIVIQKVNLDEPAEILEVVRSDGEMVFNRIEDMSLYERVYGQFEKSIQNQ